MVPTIKSGRYKVVRSTSDYFLVLYDKSNVLASLGRAEDIDEADSGLSAVWFIEVTTKDDGSTIATIQNETNKGYMSLYGEAEPGRSAPIHVQTDKKQEWVITPSASNPEEFNIQHPPHEDAYETLVIGNSLHRVYPPRLALQPLEGFVSDHVLPWRFEPAA
ncbi:hypothetical protein BGX29_006852 [Mortierella sp. GBA35]|nr:hypothetical protein BGX29_006852 [Mortierella sp. GBA35]